QITDKQPTVNPRPLFYFSAALLSVTSLCAVAADFNLPTMGQSASQVMSPAEEDRIGRRVVAQLMAHGRILEDPELTAYLNRVGDRLVSHTGHSPSEFQYYVIDSPVVNAFALPGGYIGVNAGLIMETDNESELAGVMAHETAHVTQRHIARQLEATKGMGLVAAAAILLAVIASGGNPAVIQAAITGGISAMNMKRIGYTRAHEQEADRIGIQTLAASDYDPDAMAAFFEKMAKRARLYGNQLPQILLTHPVNTARVADARARAQDYKHVPVHEFDDYAVMRARARVLASEQPSDTLRYFDELLKNGGGAAANYGYALALQRVGRVPRAIKLLKGLVDKQATYPHFVLALADAQAALGHTDQALATLRAATPKHSAYRPLILDYARLLVESGHASQARAYMLDQTQLLGRDAKLHELLARAYGQMNQLGDAYYQQAMSFRLRGKYAAAIHRLQTALELPDLNHSNRARIQAALRDYREQCHRAWSEDECRTRVEGITQPRW
ncbi:MAG: M48 family metalloprotease, partial [Salinisphaera sp.]|nr:M48 family metalloprotease [Salinisphaera sp.]